MYTTYLNGIKRAQCSLLHLNTIACHLALVSGAWCMVYIQLTGTIHLLEENLKEASPNQKFIIMSTIFYKKC